MKKGYFKGRVVEISGSRITIDTKPETREYTDKKTGEKKVVKSAWMPPEIPPKGNNVKMKIRKKDLDANGKPIIGSTVRGWFKS